MNNFNDKVLGSLEIAQAEAVKRKNTELSAWHLLYGLIQNPQTYSAKKLKEHKKTVENKLRDLPIASHKVDLQQIKPHTQLSEWLTNASSHAIQAGRKEVAEQDLLRFLPQTFPELSINYEDFNEELEEESEVPSFLINLNELAKEGKLDPVIGRTKEIRAVMEILGRRGKNNPVLVGNAGVGKTAIVEGLAEAIVKGNVPEVLKYKTVYSLDLGSLMAGTKFRGEFEERIQSLLKYIKSKAGEVILFIDEIHQLVGAGRTDGAMDAANLLKPALARGELHCVGATTYDEYQKYILGDSALDRRFRSVPVNEPSQEDSMEILLGIREKLEIHHGIEISEDAIYSAVVLSSQYITDKFLPDKAIDLIDESASALKLSAEAMPAKLAELEADIKTKKIFSKFHPEDNTVKDEIKSMEESFAEGKKAWETEVMALKQVSELKNQLDIYKHQLEQAEREQNFEEASRIKYSLIPEVQTKLEENSHNWVLSTKNVAQVIARQTGIPLEKILKDKQDEILKLEDYLKSHVYGQNHALSEIADTIIAAHAGLSDPTRPLGSFMLLGPSGVGKTETAKSLASFLFDSPENLIRIDMSEFSEKHSVAKLIGAPAGYVGYDDGGVLTEAVRRKPYSVILFDEIEKAHPDFADILLQILDDGRLTDNKGRTINFKNTILILTSNHPNPEEYFKPEVLGRLDARIKYNILDQNIMGKLVQKELSLLNERLKDKKINLNLDLVLTDKLSKEGYDERYGARPLASLFNRVVTRPLSKQLLKGELTEGDYTLGIKDGEVVFV